MNRKIKHREYPQENREHKSTLFCKAFEEKSIYWICITV